MMNTPLFTKRFTAILSILIFFSGSSLADVSTCGAAHPLPHDTWQQITLPCKAPAGENTVSKIFGDDMTGVYGVDWGLFAYNPVNNQYSTLGTSDILEGGAGYWVIQQSGVTVNIDMPDASQPTSVTTPNTHCTITGGCFEIALATSENTTQWQMLGSPFSGDQPVSEFFVAATQCPNSSGCTLAESANNNLLHDTFWSYNGTEYTVLNGDAKISPWSGFWAATLSGSSEDNPRLLMPVSEAITDTKAHRLLTQATFGVTAADKQAVISEGIPTWIDAELAKPSAYDNDDDAHKTHLQRLIQIAKNAEPGTDWNATGVFNQSTASFSADEYQMAAWWENALGHPTRTAHGSDQLRQRVAYALSQIVVVSNGETPLGRRGEALGVYYDILAKNAFGNYRDLLGEISRSPAMGIYLSHQGNRKTDLVAATNPDENFARELIQLFSIGLYELNLDGSFNRDGNINSYPDGGSNIVPTYTQDDITEMAKVMTGWDLSGNTQYGRNSNRQGDYTQPMEFTPSEHEDEVAEGGDGAVTILGQTFALNSGSDQSGLDAALDLLFQHSNIAPFISRHLIMRLVTSNPSSAYVARVASVFNNNGSGVKGDLKSVIKTILLDKEARLDSSIQFSGFGKAKEPILAFTQFLRAFHVRPLNGWIGKDKTTAVNGVYWYKAPEKHLGHAPMRSLSVFNFYSPDFIPSDNVFAQNKWVAPELQIQTDQILVEMNNRIYSVVNSFEKNKIVKIDEKQLSDFGASKKFNSDNILLIDFDDEMDVYGQALDGDTNGNFSNMELINPATGIRYKNSAIDALLEHLNQLLLGGTMSEEYRAGLKHYLLNATGSQNNNDFKEAWLNIRDAVRLIVTSSAYMVQK